MYLVHAHLRPPVPGAALPTRLPALAHAAARPEDAVEHISVHADALPDPVIGLYVLADSLPQAEAAAGAVCARLLDGHPELLGWRLVRAEVPLVPIE
ncbi:hypothetical protein [Streptomyces sp. NPDC060010]|uniref:hypothetical protein n=1 Tax=Streptomyces sp. NPDC060010 TaxID=3347036 RepID=UPI00367FD196